MVLRALAALLVLHAGWMLVDGATALATGDYIGGELGPWAALVRAVGIDPLAMRVPFVLLGLAGLAIAALVLRGEPRAPRAAAAFGIATLWYAAIGTLLALAIVVVAVAAARRPAQADR